MGTELFELEISRHDWDQLHCGCGDSAAHLVGRFVQAINAESNADIDFDWSDGHIADSVVLYEPAVPATSLALAALAGDLSLAARFLFSNLLLAMVAGESTSFDISKKGRDLPEECRQVAASGIWMLCSEVLRSDPVG